MPMDWVYRGFKWVLDDPTQQEPFLSGTYYNPISLSAGQANATAQVLVDSHNHTAAMVASGSTAGGVRERFAVGAPAVPERNQRGMLIHGCDIGIYCFHAAASWFGTAQLHLGARIVVARQDPYEGVAAIVPEYGMWGNVGTTQMTEPAQYANGRQNCWERRLHAAPDAAAAGNGAFNRLYSFRARFKRRLDADEGLFLWLELHPNSLGFTGTSFINLWCRTLVTADT